MRIADRELTGTSPANAGRAPEPSRVEGSGEPRGVESRWGSGDQVALSSLAGRLAQALDAAAATQAGRVEELGRQYDSGGYRVNSLAVSREIIREMAAELGGA